VVLVRMLQVKPEKRLYQAITILSVIGLSMLLLMVLLALLLVGLDLLGHNLLETKPLMHW